MSSFGDTLRDPVLLRWRLGRLHGAWPPPADQGSSGFAVDLARDGQRLYRAGLEDGDEEGAANGLALLNEAARAIRPSGILDHGSTLCHLQFSHAFADAWLAAERWHRPERRRLETVLTALLAVLPALTLPGGLPEIGESPPGEGVARLSGLLPGGALDLGWTGTLPPAERQALGQRRDAARLYDLERMRSDGWLRFDSGRWAGLWHGDPDGWPPADGYAHQDIGGFELHHGRHPVFVDPGSPPAGEPAVAAFYRSPLAHNGICLNGRAPYPQSRPFYNAAFRQAVAGPPPVLQAEYDGVSLSFDGYGRSGGRRQVQRRWQFAGAGFRLDDLILGTGRARVERRLITPLPVVVRDGLATLLLEDKPWAVGADSPPVLHSLRRWNDNGDEVPLTMILFAVRANLPWRGRITVTPL